jgi:hypothetical protein
MLANLNRENSFVVTQVANATGMELEARIEAVSNGVFIASQRGEVDVPCPEAVGSRREVGGQEIANGVGRMV